MVLDKALLGKAPESFKAVDADFAAGIDPFAVIHLEVPVSAEHKGILDLELVRVDYASAAHLPDGHVQERFGPYVRDGLHMNKSVPFKNAEDRDLAGGATAAFAFTFAAETGFIYFHLAAQEFLGIGCMGQNGPSKNHHGPVGDLV